MTLGEDTGDNVDEVIAPVAEIAEPVRGEPTMELGEEPYGLGGPDDDSADRPRSQWHMALDAGRVFAHGFGAILDIGMMVVGIGLLSIAVATLLDGFGVTELSLTDNSGAMLGSALLVGVFGSFALGVANEGPLTSPRQGEHVGLIASNIARAFSIIVVAAGAGWAAGALPKVLSSLPKPFGLATMVIEQTGRAGFFFALLVGVPLAVLLRMWKSDIREDADYAVIFVVWLVGTILFVNSVLPTVA